MGITRNKIKRELYMDIFNNINNLYGKISFFEKYGIDIYISIIIIILFFIAISYLSIKNNMNAVKADWNNQKCKPSVIPFAGLINAPAGQSSFSYTAENFNGCVNTILASMANYALQPIYYVMNGFTKIFDDLLDAIQAIRNILASMRDDVTAITEDIMNRSLNIVIPLQVIMLSFKDAFQKVSGTLTASIYTLLGGYNLTVSVINYTYQIIVNILIALVSIIGVLWVVPVAWPQAAAMTTIFVSISIPLAIIAGLMTEILGLHPTAIPKVPHCFDKNTLIQLQDGTFCKISEIKIGQQLMDGSIVTSTMKLSAYKFMYSLNNIIVTGKHPVYYLNKWIKVKDHPDSQLIHYDESFIYCLGTDTKIIRINNIIFSDWDELDDDDINELKQNACHVLPTPFINSDLHKYLNGGLVGDTLIDLKHKYIKIKDIKIGMKLYNGEKVIGIVKIDATKLSGVYEYNIGNTIIKGGPNLHIYCENLGVIDTTQLIGKPIYNETYLYHLVTDKRIFNIDNLIIYDYNSCIDKFLNNEKKDLIYLI